LGVSGAVDILPTVWEKNICDTNFANVLNVDVNALAGQIALPMCTLETTPFIR
jgi:hypothetical protein